MINDLISLNKLDSDPNVKQLFIEVFRKDPQSRPSALQLLKQPIISSAVEYECYFDECYDSEDAEDLEASPAAKYDGGGQISLHSLGDEMGELLQIPYGNPRQHIRGSSNSEDSGVGRDFGSSVRSGSQISSSSSSSYQQRVSCSDSGLEVLDLANSNSAPSIGIIRLRRHSLQHLDTCRTWKADTEAEGINPVGKSHLRRTGSEVYIDRGAVSHAYESYNNIMEMANPLTQSQCYVYLNRE